MKHRQVLQAHGFTFLHIPPQYRESTVIVKNLCSCFNGNIRFGVPKAQKEVLTKCLSVCSTGEKSTQTISTNVAKTYQLGQNRCMRRFFEKLRKSVPKFYNLTKTCFNGFDKFWVRLSPQSYLQHGLNRFSYKIVV